MEWAVKPSGNGDTAGAWVCDSRSLRGYECSGLGPNQCRAYIARPSSPSLRRKGEKSHVKRVACLQVWLGLALVGGSGGNQSVTLGSSHFDHKRWELPA